MIYVYYVLFVYMDIYLSGLDPAGPLIYQFFPPNQRLDPTDADFVDVINTDTTIFGFSKSIGHANFYPNGGKRIQPGCQYLEITQRNPGGIAEQST